MRRPRTVRPFMLAEWLVDLDTGELRKLRGRVEQMKRRPLAAERMPADR